MGCRGRAKGITNIWWDCGGGTHAPLRSSSVLEKELSSCGGRRRRLEVGRSGEARHGLQHASVRDDSMRRSARLSFTICLLLPSPPTHAQPKPLGLHPTTPPPSNRLGGPPPQGGPKKEQVPHSNARRLEVAHPMTRPRLLLLPLPRGQPSPQYARRSQLPLLLARRPQHPSAATRPASSSSSASASSRKRVLSSKAAAGGGRPSIPPSQIYKPPPGSPQPPSPPPPPTPPPSSSAATFYQRHPLLVRFLAGYTVLVVGGVRRPAAFLLLSPPLHASTHLLYILQVSYVWVNPESIGLDPQITAWELSQALLRGARLGKTVVLVVADYKLRFVLAAPSTFIHPLTHPISLPFLPATMPGGTRAPRATGA